MINRKSSFINKIFSFLSKPRNLGLVAIILIILTVGFFLMNALGVTKKSSVIINKEYSVTAKTQDKKLTNGKFTVKITSAQFSDSILVQGKKAKPVEGKVFLVVNMEIENTYKVPLYAFPVDLLRFIRNDGQGFAPSVHQGSVEIRPQSTKKSNVAFVVLPTEKRFKLEVGEVGGIKQTLQINF